MDFDGIDSVEWHRAFKRDFKKLSKRYRSLRDDLETFIRTSIRAVHVLGQCPEPLGHFPVQGLGDDEQEVFIAKKFACRSLKGTGGRSGIRVVYRFEKNTLHLLLIEIFYKGDKELLDLERIRGIIEKASD